MFFKKFGSINYQLDGYSKDAMNILTAVVLRSLNVDKSYVYQQYIIPAGAGPEVVANTLYKNPDHYWTVLLVNGMVDPFVDWPMSDDTLEEWVTARYDDPFKVIYFTNVTTGANYDDVDSKVFFDKLENDEALPYDAHPVTALEDAQVANNKKREITVVGPGYIDTFVELFERALEDRA